MANYPSTPQTARLRAELIMKVRCGLITGRQAAKQLGISRKTFYKWEQRGLSALLEGVTDQHPGRPPDPSNDRCQVLEKQLSAAKQEIELLNHKMALKDVLMNLKPPQTGSDRTKKK